MPQSEGKNALEPSENFRLLALLLLQCLLKRLGMLLYVLSCSFFSEMLSLAPLAGLGLLENPPLSLMLTTYR